MWMLKKLLKEASASSENIDSKSSVHNKEHVTVAIVDKGTHNTPLYIGTMDIYVGSIDKYYKKIWRKIHEAIDEPYSGEGKLFNK